MANTECGARHDIGKVTSNTVSHDEVSQTSSTLIRSLAPTQPGADFLLATMTVCYSGFPTEIEPSCKAEDRVVIQSEAI